MSRLVLSLIAAVLLSACADTKPSFPDGGVPEGGYCPEGEKRCTKDIYEYCQGGRWQQEKCAAGKFCVPKYGCKVCEPGATYCDGQDVYTCSADGESRTKKETCADGTQCVLGACVSMCEVTTGKDRSNVGCEFWAVDLPNEYACQSIDGGLSCMMHLCAACQPFAVAVANTQPFPVTVTIEQNEAAPGQPAQLTKVKEQTLKASSLEVFELGMREVDCTEWTKDASGRLRRTNDSQTCLSSRAFRIKSTAPLVAYQFNPIINDFSNGASMLLPTNGLDTKYYVLGYSTANPINPIQIPGVTAEGIPDYTNVTIVGVKEQTEVEITVTHPVQGSKDGKIPAAKAGETIKATLGPFDVLNINSLQDLANMTGDLSGTLVKASRPVAVFSGAQRALAPVDWESHTPKPPEPANGLCCTEHFEQQLFPTSALGTSFVVTHSAPRQSPTEPDFYRVLAVKDGTTTITTSLTDFPKLTVTGAGKYAKLWSDKDFTLTADKPVMVAQYTVSQGYLSNWTAGPGGDPDFVLFAPVEQHRMDYIFLTPSTFTADYVILAAPVGAAVKLDGKDVNQEMNALCPRFPAGTLKGQTYNALRCPVQDGVHRIEATKPVGITVYGYYNVGSYAYPGGADIKQINID